MHLVLRRSKIGAAKAGDEQVVVVGRASFHPGSDDLVRANAATVVVKRTARARCEPRRASSDFGRSPRDFAEPPSRLAA